MVEKVNLLHQRNFLLRDKKVIVFVLELIRIGEIYVVLLVNLREMNV